METLTNSRFITHPSLVDKTLSHTVLIVDATEDEVENLGWFCKASNKNYDLYLYRHELADEKWLNDTLKRADSVLQKDTSSVIIQNTDSTKFSNSVELLTLFENFDKN